MKKMIIYTDGGSRGNPGKAAIGAVFCDETGKILKKFGKYLGDGLTNNEAEYGAVIYALKNFSIFFEDSITSEIQIEIRSDSELLVKQMNGSYKIKNERIKLFAIEISQLKSKFAEVTFTAILREKNKEADAMVNKALDAEIV